MSSKPKATATPAPAPKVAAPISAAPISATPDNTAPVDIDPPAVAPPPVDAPLLVDAPGVEAPAIEAPAVTAAAIEPTVSAPIDSAPSAAAATEATTVNVKQGMEKVMKTAEEFVAFGQGNMDAFVKCSQIWTAGVQDLSKQVAATAQAQFDETLSVFKAMTSVKSLKDAFELQSSFARTAMEKTVAQSSRLTDASLKLTEQALAPITARVTTAVESFSKAA